MSGEYLVRCSGSREGNRRCAVLVDAREPDGLHFCSHPSCQKAYQVAYAQRPEAKRKNLRRVHRRRYGRQHRCESCVA